MAEYGIYISVSAIIALVAAVSSGVWRLHQLEAGVRKDVGAEIDGLKDELSKHERNIGLRAEEIRFQTGEMGAAIRQKIHDNEIHVRDTFVRKDSFELVIKRIESSIEKVGDRLEEKFDRAMERLNPRS